jgi:hypothetical protein
MYELLKNQQCGGIVLKESVAFQCPRSSNSRKKKARTFFAKPSPFNPQVHQLQEKAFPQKSGVAGAG